MKSRKISQIVLIVEIALIILLHVNKSSNADNQMTSKKEPFPVSSGSPSIGILTSFFK